MTIPPSVRGWYGLYDKFFSVKDSQTLVKTGISIENTTLGMILGGNLYIDTFCLGINETICYESNFIGVESIDNFWLFNFNLQNIGGILGLGFNG